MNKVEVQLNGPLSKVTVDGQDISQFCQRFIVAVDVHDQPRLIMTIPLIDKGSLAGEASVEIDAPTAELLVRLGWTPPNTPRVIGYLWTDPIDGERKQLRPEDVLIVRSGT